MDRASTIRFYDHYGHVSAAVCYQNTLHARTGDGRLDHARTHEPREGKRVNPFPTPVDDLLAALAMVMTSAVRERV